MFQVAEHFTSREDDDEGAEERKKKEKTQTAQKNKPVAKQGWTESVAHLQAERDVPCSEERPL